MRKLTLASTALLVLAASTAGARADTINGQARTARPMTAAEVTALYADRTWQWPKGAGYLAADGRFFAWSESDEFPTMYGGGRWYATGRGQMCMSANWYNIDAPERTKTCFSHRTDGAMIYQKKGFFGKWYVFKHATRTADDEYWKLKKGDRVTAKVKRARPEIFKWH